VDISSYDFQALRRVFFSKPSGPFVAGAIYLLKREGQPETFGYLPSSLWWVVVTLSTVGYGDAVPLTWLGRALGVVIMVLGRLLMDSGLIAKSGNIISH